MHYDTTTTDDEEDINVSDSDIDDDSDNNQNDNNGHEKRQDAKFAVAVGGGVFRRREWWSSTKWLEEWNRVFLLVSAMGLFVDPLFFYALSISDTCMCLFVDGWFAITVTVLRCMTDTLHLGNMWLQLKMSKRSSSISNNTTTLQYFKANRGFFFGLFVILPLPQVRYHNIIFFPIYILILI